MARRRKTTSVTIPRPAPAKSARNARTNRPVKPELDRDGKYAAACIELAGDLGFRVVEIWTAWQQFALMRIFEQGLPQAAAEESAMRDIKAAFDKRDSPASEAS